MRNNPNLDAQNAKGQTVMHLAAWNGNAQALQKLFATTADVNKQDSRGWTALQVAIASTKTEAEQAFYTANKAPNNDLVSTGQKSTIDILCDATLCENPAHAQKVRDAYEYLYADDKMRPILDLAALDAAGKREPPGSGVRFVIADHENTGDLWNASGVGKLGARGALDDGANIVMVGAKKAISKDGKTTKWDATVEDFAGCLVHEMTHLATRIVHGKDVTPYDPKDPGRKQAYLDGIQDAVKKTNLLCPSNPMEKDILDRVSERMDHYITKPTSADHELLMEHIVSVPQLMAMYGEANVGDKLGSLKDFYEDFVKEAETKKSDSRFDGIRTRVNTNANDNLAKQLKTKWPRPVVEETWTGSQDGDRAELSVDAIVKKVEQELTCQEGTPQFNPGISVAYNVKNFKVTDPTKAKEIKAKVAKIKQALTDTFGKDGLPPSVSTEDYRKLITETTKMARNTRTRKLEDAVKGQAGGWLREAKIKYVDHQITQGEDVAPEHLAEAIVLKAEQEVHSKGTGQGDLEVNQKKHKELVEPAGRGPEKDAAQKSPRRRGQTVEKHGQQGGRGLSEDVQEAIGPREP